MNVESYEAAGRNVGTPLRACPDCGGPLILWSGYGRYVRGRERVHRIWIRRCRCRPCARSHALIPSFLLVRRVDPAAVIGAGLARSVWGLGLRSVAAALEVPHTTVRGWRWRFRARAPVLAAGFGSLAVALGGAALELSAHPEAAALEALAGAWDRARIRLGGSIPGPFGFASVVSGGALLATNTTPPWAGLLGGSWMPPVPTDKRRSTTDAT
ncbi:MAG TPA: DUF6431 domain-containing protein [Acidimicrobiales bacterium]|jgi:hypothetical protein|nr:DUF6431 domain-containing protein [Acidimicrobiales bacterium]